MCCGFTTWPRWPTSWPSAPPCAPRPKSTATWGCPTTCAGSGAPEAVDCRHLNRRLLAQRDRSPPIHPQQEVPPMSIFDRSSLQASSLSDLHAIASELSIDGYRRLRKDDLISAILERQSTGASEEAPADPLAEAMEE